MIVRCPFCHKYILQWFYEAHSRKHMRKKPDGQHNDHITNAPDDRYRGPLDGVPRSYRHARCGGGTGMPEEIIRSYLVNPLLYIDRSFCTGCGDYVDCSELTWVETGENMMTYNGRLRANYLERVLGISRARQRQEAVIVTPDGAAAVDRIAAERKLPPPYSFALQWDPAKSKSGYSSWVIGEHQFNRQTHVFLESSGVEVIVPKAQLEWLRGTIVDYHKGPQGGFQMSRLYPRPKRAPS